MFRIMKDLRPHGVCMEKKYKYIVALAGGLIILALSQVEASAQDLIGNADGSAEQTLFQENVQSDSAQQSVAPELETPSAKPAPPSLSLQDYLNQRDGGASTNPPVSPGMDLQVGAPNGVSANPISQEQVQAEEDNKLRKQAFDSVKAQIMPLKPEEIRRLLELYDETKQASVTPVYTDPEMESSFQRISLDPGAKPLTIKTAIGHVTTLSIVDVTGQPWPIHDLTWAGDFQIEQPEQGGHMLRITPTKDFATGNISMRLVGLNPPVIFSLRTERRSVHMRLDVQVPEVGPKGVLPPVETQVTTTAGDDFLTSVLIGVVGGNDVRRLDIDGIDGRTSAFEKDGMMYVRTPYTMLSPAWSQSVQSGDGTKVYALNYSPVILLSEKGKMVRAYLSRKEQSDEQY